MPDENWQRVKDLFADTLDEPRENRLEFLRHNCGGDEQLFEEVESLLDANAETEQIIERNGFNLSSKLIAGKNYDFTKFGRYTVLKEIGRGGMGAVFLAERSDGEFEQKAALKIIRQNFAGEEIERHFRRERQILASLNHPNIAKLLDGGVSDAGELFLVMEYIEGEPLLEYAGNNKLNVEEKLRLFTKICRSVSFAHQNLIVHRDIKPSNILVGKDGEPKLLDFGLAKMTSEEFDPAQTATVFRAFTPSYASPEQIHGGNITTASDIYSLGVVLYELLTGEKPFHFEGKSIEEIFKTIDFTEPMPPSSVGDSKLKANESSPKYQIPNLKLLAGDLDNITLKALRKEPTRRYKSVEAFSDDIERYLKGLPISARSNTTGYRAAKFFQRNKIIVSSAALVVLALISGLAIALWQANVARRERDRAEKRFSDVRELSNALLFKITPKIERLGGSIEAREILVNESLKYLDGLASESANDSALQSELASAYEKIGDLQGAPRQPNLSDFSGAVASYEKAQAIRLKFTEVNPNDIENRHLLALNHARLSSVYYGTSDLSRATTESETALEIYTSLITEQPDRLDFQTDYAAAEIERANIYYYNSQFAELFPLIHKTLAQLENLESRNPDNNEIQVLICKSRTLLGSGLSWDGKQTEAEVEMKKALEISERLVRENPNDNLLHQELPKTYWETAGINEEVNDKNAYEFLLKALKVGEDSVRQDAADGQARENLATTFYRLGAMASNLKNYKQSIEYLDKSQKILTELQKAEPKNQNYKMQTGRLYTRYGFVKANQNDWQNAIADYRKAIEIFQAITQIGPRNDLARRYLAGQYVNIAEVHANLIEQGIEENQKKHKSEALDNYNLALDIYLQLQWKNSVSDYDRKTIEKIQAAERKLQN